MEEKKLIEIWKKGDRLMKDGQITDRQIEKLLKPRISRFTVFFNTQLFTYLLAQIAALILLTLNIFGYIGNPIMQMVTSALLGVTLLFLFFGVELYRSFSGIKRQHTDIFGLLKAKVHFFSYRFELWNVVAAVTIWILVFAINTYMDNDGGTYRINKPVVYILVSLGMLALIYVTNRMVVATMLRETRTSLKELTNTLMSGDMSLAELRRRQVRFNLIAFAILSLLAIAGLLVFLGRC